MLTPAGSVGAHDHVEWDKERVMLENEVRELQREVGTLGMLRAMSSRAQHKLEVGKTKLESERKDLEAQNTSLKLQIIRLSKDVDNDTDSSFCMDKEGDSNVFKDHIPEDTTADSDNNLDYKSNNDENSEHFDCDQKHVEEESLSSACDGSETFHSAEDFFGEDGGEIEQDNDENAARNSIYKGPLRVSKKVHNDEMRATRNRSSIYKNNMKELQPVSERSPSRSGRKQECTQQ